MRSRSLLVVIAAGLLLATCKVQLLDDYDKTSEDALLRTYGQIESLFDAIAEAPDSAARSYRRFASRYAEIQEAIRVQVLRQSARPLNRESFGIISIIDTVFAVYRQRHRDSPRGLPDVLLERQRANMRRLFMAALRAERVRKDETER